mmetsp:Transcript_89038/g.265604  ORF Transcript_89038/g.265604 Transcript_89038/m.265604 type:complete len:200 (-) Transcript_89038:166-765(-)
MLSRDLSGILTELGKVQRNIRWVEDKHHHDTNSIPAVDIRHVDNRYGRHVVRHHLSEVLPPEFKQQRDERLEVAADVEEVVALEIRAHDFVPALRKANPPPGAWPHKLLGRHNHEAEHGETAVDHGLHGGLRKLGHLRPPKLHACGGEGLHQDETDPPVQDEHDRGKDAEDVPVPRNVRGSALQHGDVAGRPSPHGRQA